jgi:repressor LexA
MNDPIDDQTLKVIADYIDEHGWPPSYRDIGLGIGATAPSTIVNRIRRLVERGLIEVGVDEKGHQQPRALRIVRADTKTNVVEM